MLMPERNKKKSITYFRSYQKQIYFITKMGKQQKKPEVVEASNVSLL